MADYKQFSVGSRWPDRGFEVSDQHGRVYGRTERFNEAMELMIELRNVQDRAIAREAAGSVDKARRQR